MKESRHTKRDETKTRPFEKSSIDNKVRVRVAAYSLLSFPQTTSVQGLGGKRSREGEKSESMLCERKASGLDFFQVFFPSQT